MSQVLAVTAAGPPHTPVAETAAVLGHLVRAQVQRLRLAKGLDSEQETAVVLSALDDPSTELCVLAAQPSADSVCWQVVQRATKPIVLVPKDAVLRTTIGRVLLPLDGTAESAAAVAQAVELFARAGVDLVVLHVFNSSTTPRFWDQTAHATRAWSEEFLSRNVTATGAHLELRTGSPGEHVVDVADTVKADLITLGWSQQLDPGRARTVRRTVLAASLPVLLVPLVGG